MIFEYRAITEDGRTVRGRTEAPSIEALERELLANQLTLLDAKSRGATTTGRRKALTARERIDFFYQLESMLRAGVPLTEILADMRDSAESPATAYLATDLYRRVQEGETLSEALAAHPEALEPMMVALVRTGEATGQLPDVLAQIVASLKWRDELKAQLKKAVSYPAFVTVVITGVVVFLMVYLVPQLVDFLKNMGQELPLMTRALIATSEFVVNRWYLLIGVPTAIVVLSSLLARFYPPYRQWLHRRLLQLPLMGPIIHKIILARFADTFGLMYKSGVPILQAMDLCQDVTANLEVRTALEHATRLVTQGIPISQAFASSGLFPPLVVRMLRIGEQTGALDDALANVSYFYARDVNESIARLQSLLEPTLTVILGLILGWIMIAVLGPVYDTISKIRT